MSWNIVDRGEFVLYINQVIDLKIKVYETKDKDEIYINYKGYNVIVTMLMWKFMEEYLEFTSIQDIKMEWSGLHEHFIINKRDRDEFLSQIFYFLMENKIGISQQQQYKYEDSWD